MIVFINVTYLPLYPPPALKIWQALVLDQQLVFSFYHFLFFLSFLWWAIFMHFTTKRLELSFNFCQFVTTFFQNGAWWPKLLRNGKILWAFHSSLFFFFTNRCWRLEVIFVSFIFWTMTWNFILFFIIRNAWSSNLSDFYCIE